MRCPYCLSTRSRVVDKRDVPETDTIRRRRECLDCGKRYTTHERIERAALSVIKKDGRREAFDREKLVGGLLRACEKRPVPREAVEELADAVEAEARDRGNREVPASELGLLVMRRLRDLDKVAYIRFASVYQEFTDLGSFEAEVRKLKKLTARFEQQLGGEHHGQGDSADPQARRAGRPVRPGEDHRGDLGGRPGGRRKRPREG